MPIVTTTGLIPAATTTATLPPIQWAIAAGTSDAITGAYTPANTVLTDGLILGFRALFANATTTPTFSPDGLTAHTITRYGGQALFAGDIGGALAECFVRYNLANTRWELLNPVGRSKTPTYQSFTSGSGTYTPPAGVTRIKCRLIGGGAGGGTSGSTGINSGGQSAFGSTTAKGATSLNGASGGTTVTGTEIIRLQGGNGGTGSVITAAGQQISGGIGGSSAFGDFGAPGAGGQGSNSAGSSSQSGNGGGAGEYVEFFVLSPGAVSYTVGGGGNSPGGGGTGGVAGALLVEEFYS